MKCGIYIHTFDEFSNPAVLAGLAAEAEAAGWDGFFLWDMIQNAPFQAAGDPWIALAAIAANTGRIRLGPLVTPLARRRPWKVAREALSLDHLSGGRLILGVGLGATSNFRDFGETTDPKDRAAMLDEGLAIISGLWSGEPFRFEGEYYQIEEAHFLPKALQEPRIPIWVAGYWPNKAPFRRAARWEGIFPFGRDLKSFDEMLSPLQMRELVGTIAERRPAGAPFDAVQVGVSAGEDRPAEAAVLGPYAEAGATWWLEHIYPGRFDLEGARRRIGAGPPTEA